MDLLYVLRFALWSYFTANAPEIHPRISKEELEYLQRELGLSTRVGFHWVRSCWFYSFFGCVHAGFIHSLCAFMLVLFILWVRLCWFYSFFGCVHAGFIHSTPTRFVNMNRLCLGAFMLLSFVNYLGAFMLLLFIHSLGAFMLLLFIQRQLSLSTWIGFDWVCSCWFYSFILWVRSFLLLFILWVGTCCFYSFIGCVLTAFYLYSFYDKMRINHELMK